MKRLSKNFIFKHLATFSFKIHILNSKPPSDKILSDLLSSNDKGFHLTAVKANSQAKPDKQDS